MIRLECKINNSLGLHARAAAQLVKTANRFRSDIHLIYGKKEINGKSILGVLTLAAKPGTIITVKINGPDEGEAANALKQLIENKFGEN